MTAEPDIFMIWRHDWTEVVQSLLQLAVSETIITLYGTSGIWHQGMPVSHFYF